MNVFTIKNQKKKFSEQGIFHTSKELSLKLKEYIPDNITEIYDPTCGAGDLLGVFDNSIKKYGQEIENEFLEYAKNNLVNFTGVCGDTLKNPSFLDKKFDYVIANPPFSIKWEPRFDERFEKCGVLAPKSKADYAFILHCLYMAKKKAVVLCFPGVLYRGNSELSIRKWLVDNNFIERIVQIPPKQFDDTNISTVIIVLSKQKENTDVIFEDSENSIIKTIKLCDIIKNNYNLSVSSYCKKEINKEKINPIILEIKARESMLKKFRADLEFSKLVCEFENITMEQHIKEIKNIIREFEDKSKDYKDTKKQLILF